MKKYSTLIPLFLLLFAATATAEQEVGFVVGWTGDVSLFRLERQGTRIEPIQVLTPLYAGDKITPPKAWTRTLTWQSNDGRVQKVSGSPVVLKSMGRESSSVTHLVDWARAFLTQSKKEPKRRVMISRAWGTDYWPPGFPLASDDTREAYLVTGSRRLELAWTGGMAPYRLSMVRMMAPKKEGETLIDVSGLKTSRFSAARTAFEQGEYRVQISDLRGKQIKVTLVFVAAERLPKMPPEVKLPDELRETLYALWLAGQPERQWCFEAYQRLFSQAAFGYEPAITARDALAAGKLPVGPPDLQ